MLGIKIVLTIIITLGLVLVYLGSNPLVSGFFDSVGQRLSFDTTARNVDFTLTADRYSDFEFSSTSPANFTIAGDSSAVLKTGNLNTNKTLGIYGFRGSGSIKGNTLLLDGRMTKVELPEITVAVQETVKSNSTFTSLSTTNIGLKEFKLVNVSGTLTVGSTATSFSGDITIESPLGDFGFYVANQTFILSGSAASISLPGAGITIK